MREGGKKRKKKKREEIEQNPVDKRKSEDAYYKVF